MRACAADRRADRRPHAHLVPFGLSLALACGGGDDAPAPQGAPPPPSAAAPAAPESVPSGPLDACTVVTAADIRETLGWDPGAPVAGDYGLGGTRCVWPAADGTDPLRMTVIYLASSPLRAAERSVEEARDAGIEFERLDGPGDLTTWVFGDLQMWAKGQKVQIARPGSDDRAGAIALAERALARLP